MTMYLCRQGELPPMLFATNLVCFAANTCAEKLLALLFQRIKESLRLERPLKSSSPIVNPCPLCSFIESLWLQNTSKTLKPNLHLSSRPRPSFHQGHTPISLQATPATISTQATPPFLPGHTHFLQTASPPPHFSSKPHPLSF